MVAFGMAGCSAAAANDIDGKNQFKIIVSYTHTQRTGCGMKNNDSRVHVCAGARFASLFDLAYSRSNVHDWPHTCTRSHTCESH